MNERERATLSVVDTSRFTNREGVLTGLPLNIYTRIEVIGYPRLFSRVLKTVTLVKSRGGVPSRVNVERTPSRSFRRAHTLMHSSGGGKKTREKKLRRGENGDRERETEDVAALSTLYFYENNLPVELVCPR